MSIYTSSTNFTLGFNGTYFIVGQDQLPYPLTIINSNVSSSITVTLLFEQPINDINQYLIMGSNLININTITSNYINPVIIQNTLTNYSGLIQNSSNTDIVIQNVILISSDTASNPSLAQNAGWIVQSGCSFVRLVNCMTSLLALNNNGGLVGSNASNMSAIGCSYGGLIINGSGGIFGPYSQYITAENCTNSRDIANGSGGIFGPNCSKSTAINCSNSGDVINGSGGIFGPNCNNGATQNASLASYCFSSGMITGNSGGIFGPNCNNFGTDSSCVANDCYSLGQIGKIGNYDNGGIFGPSANIGSSSSSCDANRCFAIGIIFGDGFGANGGIFGGVSRNSYANQCYSSGPIGLSSGGIFGGSAYLSNATNCYSVGEIGGGGIFSGGANTCTATNCYSVGNIGVFSGGIFGYGSINSTSTNCYSIGTNNSGGGIFAGGTNTCTASNCYTTGSANIFEDGLNNNCVQTNCFIDNGWHDANATSVLLMPNWVRLYQNVPYLLSVFVVSVNDNTGASIGSAVPGYSYFYIIPDSSIIVNGFYSSSQVQPCHPGNYNTNIYGYNIIAYPTTSSPPPIIRNPGGTIKGGFGIYQTC